jgi:hypothetical protein
MVTVAGLSTLAYLTRRSRGPSIWDVQTLDNGSGNLGAKSRASHLSSRDALNSGTNRPVFKLEWRELTKMIVENNRTTRRLPA